MKSTRVELAVVTLFFALVGCFYLGANLLAGQIVAPTDLLFAYAGWQEVGPAIIPHSIGRSDVVDGLLPQWVSFRESLISGRFPIWDPLRAGGQPGFVWLPSGTISVGFLLFALFGNGVGFTIVLLARLVIAGLGTYLLCRTRLKPLPSLFGGVTYMMCGFNSSWLMVSAVETSMWIPWVLWAIIRLEEKPRVRRAAALAVLVSAMIFGGFPAVAGYAFYASALLILWLIGNRMIRDRQVHDAICRGIWMAISWCLGIAIAAIQIFPFIEYMQQFDISWRQTLTHGLPTAKAILLLNPFQAGLPWVETTGYVGIIAVSLAGLAIVSGLSRRQTYGLLSPRFWAILLALTLTIIYEAPQNLARLLYQLPVLNSSLPSRTFVLLGLEFAILGAIGLEILWKIFERVAVPRRFPRWRTLVTFLILAIIMLQAADLSRVGRAQNTIVSADTFFPDTPTLRYVREHLQEGQSVVATGDAYMVSGTLSAYGIPEWFAHAYHTTQEKTLLSQVVRNAWVTPTAAVFSFDQIDTQSSLFDALAIRYILTYVFSTRDYQQILADRPVQLLPQHTVGQVITFPETYYILGVDVLMATYSRPTAGADALVRFFDAHSDKLAESKVNGEAIRDNKWIRFRFNQPMELPPGECRFDVQIVEQATGPVAVWSQSNGGGFAGGYMTVDDERAPGDLAFRIVGLPKRLMQGWTVMTPGDLIIVLERQTTPPGAYVLSENAPWDEPDPQSWNWKNVTMLEHDSNHQVFEVEAEHSGWLVRVARDWPGWVAYVNGKPSQIRPYLGMLPGVHIEAGASRVEWRYEPSTVKTGAAFSTVALLVLSLICFLPAFRKRKSEQSGSDDHNEDIRLNALREDPPNTCMFPDDISASRPCNCLFPIGWNS